VPFASGKTVKLSWTLHAQAKMMYYRLSPMRVRRVLNAPKRVEEGVAPKTIAMMQPASLKSGGGRPGAASKERWTQEIWVMVQDIGRERKVISAWRYPGVTKPRDETVMKAIRKEYNEYADASH
jgi:hypothetical protein